jgi:3'(2'), 5'-bisphosphate nucleotidase
MTNVTERTKVYPATAFARELAVARDAAVRAGAAIMRFYGDAAHVLKEGGSPVSAADHASNDVILAALRDAFPGDAILSEETKDSPERLSSERVWIVDPLDGTKEFLAGIGEFAVMIALLVDGQLKVGVVYKPADDVLYYATAGSGAYRVEGAGAGAGEGERLTCAPAGEFVRVVGSRSHADPLVAELCRRHAFTDIEPCGSVGLKCTRIAEGLRDLYLHPVPYMGEWDTAAPEIILAEAGGAVTDCRGKPLEYNKANPRQPHGILAAHPALVQKILPTIAELQNLNV